MIPQPRVVHIGARGPDIVGYKGGLVHAGVRPTGLSRTTTFGSRMRDEVIRFQRRHGLNPDGVIGPATYAALYPSLGSYARQLLLRADVMWREKRLRDRVVGNLLWSCQTTLYPFFTYRQIRPYPVNHPYRLIDAANEVFTDCSGFVGMIAKWSGAPSPFPGFGFDGLGNTDTMMELPHVNGTPQPGDLVLYTNPGHVVSVIRYPFAVSFGSEPGPIKLDSTWRPHVGFRDYLSAAA